MRNLHQVVVDDIRQVVRRQFIGTLVEHLVIAYIALYAHLATNEVVDQNLMTTLHFEPYDILTPSCYQRIDLLLGQRQRIAHLEARMAVVLEVRHLLAFLLQFLRSIEGNVGLVVVKQLAYVPLIYISRRSD